MRNEREVEEQLVKPLLKLIGWRLGKSNCQVWISLSTEMAALWSYRSKRMCRDYVLGDPRSGIHIEAKHRWSGWRMDMTSFLDRINRSDFTGTEKDGAKKDLALLLWGAEACGARRAAVIDESRLMVFRRDMGWRIAADTRLDDLASFVAAAELLKPKPHPA
jgi:hypothetical protein